jgi:hypothetical protein
MAQKRMFDKAIIDTDKFMDLPMSAKALYFLLGMEADDEGFVSYKKILRIHGGNEDDARVLEAKNFTIKFPSGVVVITDWNKNNWLDGRRIKETEYQTEKKLLAINKDRSYCLANAKPMLSQSRVEEYSIEENSIEKSKKHSSLEYLKNIPKEDLLEFKDKGFTESMVKSKAEDLLLYCQSKGKLYKNYKAFLLNALNKDYGKKVEVSDKYSSIKKITINNDNNTK